MTEHCGIRENLIKISDLWLSLSFIIEKTFQDDAQSYSQSGDSYVLLFAEKQVKWFSLFFFFSYFHDNSLSVPSLLSFSSPPGSPTTVGFFPSPSSLSSPGGLVRMPGLTYNSNGVKDLINAVQGYQVRDISLQINPALYNWLLMQLEYMQILCAFRVHILFCRIQVLYSALPLSWVCIVRYTLCFPRGYQTSLSCLLTLFCHTCNCCLLRLVVVELKSY